MNQARPNPFAVMRAVPIVQQPAPEPVYLSEVVWLALVRFASRTASTFIGTFLAGALLILLCYGYARYKVAEFSDNMGKSMDAATRKMIGNSGLPKAEQDKILADYEADMKRGKGKK